MIGDEIEITIVDIRGDKVRIGIQAPLHIPVHRKEVYVAIKQANLEAAGAGAEAIDELARVTGFEKKKMKNQSRGSEGRPQKKRRVQKPLSPGWNEA
jgi:carbon storage regulator